MGLEKRVFDEEIECSCGYETAVAFSFNGKDWFCGNCTADLITEHYEIVPVIEEERK